MDERLDAVLERVERNRRLQAEEGFGAAQPPPHNGEGGANGDDAAEAAEQPFAEEGTAPDADAALEAAEAEAEAEAEAATMARVAEAAAEEAAATATAGAGSEAAAEAEAVAEAAAEAAAEVAAEAAAEAAVEAGTVDEGGEDDLLISDDEELDAL